MSWQIDAYHFDIPVMAAPMDSVVSPESAIALGKLGALPVLDLEGLWTRYEDPTAQLSRDRRARPRRRDGPDAADLRRADQARAHHRAPAPAARGRRHGGRRAVAAAHPAALEDRRRRRRRPLRHPWHDGLGRARLGPRRAAQPQALHLRARRARHRRRRRVLHGGPAPHAHRRGRRPRRLRRRRRAHDADRARHPRPDGLGRRRRRRGPPRLPRRVGWPLRPRHRRRRRRHLGRHRQGRRVRRRRGHARGGPGPGDRRPRRRLPLGSRGAPPAAAPR